MHGDDFSLTISNTYIEHIENMHSPFLNLYHMIIQQIRQRRCADKVWLIGPYNKQYIDTQKRVSPD